MSEQIKMPEFTDADQRTTPFHDFATIPIISGKLIGIETGSFGNQYKILQSDGSEIMTGTYNVLDSKIQKADIGKFIKIECLGDVLSPKTKRTYKDFKVYIK